MSEFIYIMGPIFWVMLAFCLFSIAILTERLYYFHRININAEDFIRGLSSLLRAGKYEEALHEARQLPGPKARVIASLLERPFLKRREMRDIAIESAHLEIGRVERNIRFLLVTATMMPLLGILGTMLALMQFYEQSGITNGAAAAPEITQAIHQSLICSTMGIALAIPFYLFYMFLVSRARKTINDMKHAGLNCAHMICDTAKERANAQKKTQKIDTINKQ